MRFVVLVKANKESEAGVMPDEKMPRPRWGRFNEGCSRRPACCSPARDCTRSSKGTRIKFSKDGKRTLTDGPFSETKELVAGFWMIQVKSKDEAIEWMKRAPFQDEEIELRQVFETERVLPAYAPEAMAQEEKLRAKLEQQQRRSADDWGAYIPARVAFGNAAPESRESSRWSDPVHALHFADIDDSGRVHRRGSWHVRDRRVCPAMMRRRHRRRLGSPARRDLGARRRGRVPGRLDPRDPHRALDLRRAVRAGATRASRWSATGDVWRARVAATELPSDDLLRLSRVGPELALRSGVAAGHDDGWITDVDATATG